MSAEEVVDEQFVDPGDAGRDFLLDVLGAMRLATDVEVDEEEDGTFRLNVIGDDAGLIIGRNGDTINSLQYLTTLVVQKQTGEHVRITLDAEGYRDRREAALVQTARKIAGEVARAGQEAELDPLNPFERRIIHNALAEHPEVVTYSEGEEPERRVIIAPRPRKV